MEDSFVRKIHALKSKAESTEHPAEADAFMGKVRELLDKHNLSMSDIHIDTDPINIEKNSKSWKNYADWRSRLAYTVAWYFDCDLLISSQGGNDIVSIIGREGPRITTSVMIDYAFEAVKRSAKDNFPHIRSSVAQRHIANALADKLHKLYWKRRQEAERAPENNTRGALIVTDEIEAWIKNNHPDVVFTDAHHPKLYADAQRAAANINFDEQVGRNKSTLKIGAGT